MRICIGRSRWQDHSRSKPNGVVSKAKGAARVAFTRLVNPLRQLVKPVIGCFVGKPGSQSSAAATSEVIASEVKQQTTVSAGGAVLVPQYEGPIMSPIDSQLQTSFEGFTLLDGSCAEFKDRESAAGQVFDKPTSPAASVPGTLAAKTVQPTLNAFQFDSSLATSRAPLQPNLPLLGMRLPTPVTPPVDMSASPDSIAAGADVVSSLYEQLSDNTFAECHATHSPELTVSEQPECSLPTETASGAQTTSQTKTASAPSADASSGQLLNSTVQTVSQTVTDKSQTDHEECINEAVSMLMEHKVVDTLVEDLVGDAVEYASLEQRAAADVVTALPAPKDTVSQTESSQHDQEAAAESKATTCDVAPHSTADRAEASQHATQAENGMTESEAVTDESAEEAAAESEAITGGNAPQDTISQAQASLHAEQRKTKSQAATSASVRQAMQQSADSDEASFIALPTAPSDTPSALLTVEESELPSLMASNRDGSSAAEEVQADTEQVQASFGEQASRVIVGGGWWQDRAAFEEMVKAVPTDPSQVCRAEWKVGSDLGEGPAHRTILSMPPAPSTALPSVLKISTREDGMAADGFNSVAEEALMLFLCAHPNVVPLSFLGLNPSPSPSDPQDPRQIAYFGMPMADMSLRKSLGLQAWGKNSQAAMKGPCLLTLVKHAQAVLKPLAHIHRHRVLHRGLTPDHVLLFSKGSMEAEEAERRATRPPPIKHNIRLTGFGAAARLNERGYALQRSPYRCEEGYTPPEAHLGARLTAAADVYQFGGLCYFMALGCDPPAPGQPNRGPAELVLPDHLPEEWRLLVSLCRAPTPADRPTIAQLQLYLLDLCHHFKKAPRQSRSTPSNGGSGARPAQLKQAQQPSTVHLKAPDAIMEPVNSSPKMVSNPIYSSREGSVSPGQTPTDHKARSWISPLTALASRIPLPGATSHTGVGTTAAGLGVGLLVPKLMPAVEQWLPHETVTLIARSPDSSASSPLAAATPSKQSTAAPALVTSEELAVSGSLLSSHNMTSRTDIGKASGAAVPSIFGGSRSEKHESAHASPSPLTNLTDAVGKICDVISSKQAASDYPSSRMLYQTVPPSSPLVELQENGEQHIRATDVGHLVHMNRALRQSPASRLAPRRDDSALERSPMAKWIALTQDKAAAVTAAVNRSAASMVEQTSGLLQQWSEAQLSANTTFVKAEAKSVVVTPASLGVGLGHT